MIRSELILLLDDDTIWVEATLLALAPVSRGREREGLRPIMGVGPVSLDRFHERSFQFFSIKKYKFTCNT